VLQGRRRPPEVSGPSTPVWVSGDPVRLTQVICNLLTNAAKFSTPDQRIAIALTRHGDSASLSVEDDGRRHPGRARAAHLRALRAGRAGAAAGERRSRPRPGDRQEPGRAAWRTIAVESAGVGKGARFTVTLPTSRRGGAGTGAGDRHRDGASPTRLLVVDDNDDAAQSLALALRLEGHEVETAPTATRRCACSTASGRRRRSSTSACRR
jgi:hypothetical protein